MPSKAWTSGLLLTTLAVVFSLGLTFASVEIPGLLHGALERVLPSNDGDSHADDAALLRTELFMRHYHLRAVGYFCFGLMVLLIVLGFAIGKKGPVFAGALLLFLPVFAQFAAVMFFLAGLGVLNLVWLPVLDVSLDAGYLGEIVYLPYRLVLLPFSHWGLDIHEPIVILLLGTGLLVFILGTVAWFFARCRGRNVADFWIYRFSRHPQYLGWIIWSYGMLLMLMRVSYPKRSWSIGASFPWLLSAMIIIGVALMEEQSMRRRAGDAYERFRRTTPFLLPLPKLLPEALTWPTRLLFKKRVPERTGEIAAVLALYTLVLVGLSAVYAHARNLPPIPDAVRAEMPAGASTAEAYTLALRSSDNWHARRPYVRALEEIGEAAVEPLIELLHDPDSSLRQIAANTLGTIGSETVVAPLIASLSDPDGDVRFWAAGSLGRLRAVEAVAPLILMVKEQPGSSRLVGAIALGRIGSVEAVEPLVCALDDPNPWTRAAVIHALGQLGDERAVEPLLAILEREDSDVHVRRAIVVAFGEISSERTIDTLRSALNDDDAEVRLYAEEALENVRSNGRP
jgi:HEAT repeat protein/protein-S-isoprenylcysteine O-methyltransferase Ste14